MTSIAQITEMLEQILEVEAEQLAKEVGFIQRERAFSGADFAQTLILGWLQQPEVTLDGLTQILQRREVTITAAGLTQRFTPQAAAFLEGLLERLSQVRLQAEAVDIALLKRFSAVVVEDSSLVTLPHELATSWSGCGGSAGASPAAVKLFVRWDVLAGSLQGPRLSDGRHSDKRSPFLAEEVPEGGLYLADLGFFGVERLSRLAQPATGQKRYFVSRLQTGPALFTRAGHRIELRGILPAQVGQALEMGVLLGKQQRLPVRLLHPRGGPGSGT